MGGKLFIESLFCPICLIHRYYISVRAEICDTNGTGQVFSIGNKKESSNSHKNIWRTNSLGMVGLLGFISDIQKVLYVSEDPMDVRNHPQKGTSPQPVSSSKPFRACCSSHFRYRCIILTIYFRNETKFNFLHFFFQKHSSLQFEASDEKFCLLMVGVAAVFFLIKVMSKFHFRHFLDKKWKELQFGFVPKTYN